MKAEDQRIAIAEACGISDPWRGCYWADGVGDYLNDLNAMHDAEKVLTEAQAARYGRLLEKSRRFTGAAEFFTYHATAAQRAEAFLRTIGRWSE